MPDYTYSDAVPDAAANADFTSIVAEQVTVVGDENVEQSTPNYQGALTANVNHQIDQENVNLDDYAVDEQRRQLDLVQNVYGATNSSDISEAESNLTNLGEVKATDQQKP